MLVAFLLLLARWALCSLLWRALNKSQVLYTRPALATYNFFKTLSVCSDSKAVALVMQLSSKAPFHAVWCQQTQGLRQLQWDRQAFNPALHHIHFASCSSCKGVTRNVMMVAAYMIKVHLRPKLPVLLHKAVCLPVSTCGVNTEVV